MITGDVVVVWVVVVLMLLLSHWFRWPGHLHYLSRYVIGTLCLNVPFTVWFLGRDYERSILWVLWGGIVLGGAVVLLAYGWDWALNNWCRRKVLEAANNND